MAVVGCGVDERLAPAPTGAGTNSSSGSGQGGEGGAPPAGTVKRTVEVRNPMGGPAGNLLLDGDFEFSIVLEGYDTQAGWSGFNKNGTARRYLRAETGGLCRSGLRCGVLTANTLLYGRGTAASGVGMLAWLWAKPPAGGKCTLIRPTLINCNFSGLQSQLAPDSEEPLADGWCRYRTSAPRQDTAACMLIESSLTGDETALLDNAGLVPDDGTVSPRAMQPVGGEDYLRYQRVSRFVRDLTPIGRPPRPPAAPR